MLANATNIYAAHAALLANASSANAQLQAAALQAAQSTHNAIVAQTEALAQVAGVSSVLGDHGGQRGHRGVQTKDDNLYIRGLPQGLTDDGLRAIFSQYCTVVSCKVLPPVPGKDDAAGFVRTLGADQAKWILENMHGKVPVGLYQPLSIRLAGTDYNVEDGDWMCPNCGNANFRRRDTCNRCGTPKPQSALAAQQKARTGNSLNLYVKGLPAEMTDELLAQIFSQYGEVKASRVLPLAYGKTTAAGFVRMGEEDAEWVVVNMNGGIPNGMSSTISVCIADDGKGKGKGEKGGKNLELQVAEIEVSDNLFVKGLPHDIVEHQLIEIFNRYGTVTSVKVLPGVPHPDKPMVKSSALIRMSSVMEAKHMIDNWNGRTLHGLRHPVMIKYAGDGVPLVHKIQKMLENGDKLYYGHIKSFNVDKRFGYIGCEEVHRMVNQDVYAHQTVLERGTSGPGDSAIFFIHWKGTTPQARPQAAAPMMRISAECTATQQSFALKGWYKGIADPEKGFGFIECAELKLIFGRDVYVNKELAFQCRPGWCCFNCKLMPDHKDGKEILLPMATGLESCEKDWKPIPGDLTTTREDENSLTNPWKCLNMFMTVMTGGAWEPASPEGGGVQAWAALAQQAGGSDEQSAPEEQDAGWGGWGGGKGKGWGGGGDWGCGKGGWDGGWGKGGKGGWGKGKKKGGGGAGGCWSSDFGGSSGSGGMPPKVVPAIRDATMPGELGVTGEKRSAEDAGMEEDLGPGWTKMGRMY